MVLVGWTSGAGGVGLGFRWVDFVNCCAVVYCCWSVADLGLVFCCDLLIVGCELCFRGFGLTCMVAWIEHCLILGCCGWRVVGLFGGLGGAGVYGCLLCFPGFGFGLFMFGFGFTGLLVFFGFTLLLFVACSFGYLCLCIWCCFYLPAGFGLIYV